MLSEIVDTTILVILLLAAFVVPIWAIATDKKKYITPNKKEQSNGSAQDRP